MLKTKTVGAEATQGRHPGEASKARARPRSRSSTTWCCRRWAACPNGKKIGAEKAGVSGQRPRLHSGRHPDAHQRAAHLRDRRHRRPADARAQGGARGARRGRGAPASSRRRQAASAFDARVIPSVAYTDPEIAWVGLTEDEAKAQRHQGQEGPVPVDRVGPRDRQRPRRRLHQAAVRRARRTASSAAASSARTPAT